MKVLSVIDCTLLWSLEFSWRSFLILETKIWAKEPPLEGRIAVNILNSGIEDSTLISLSASSLCHKGKFQVPLPTSLSNMKY